MKERGPEVAVVARTSFPAHFWFLSLFLRSDRRRACVLVDVPWSLGPVRSEEQVWADVLELRRGMFFQIFCEHDAFTLLFERRVALVVPQMWNLSLCLRRSLSSVRDEATRRRTRQRTRHKRKSVYVSFASPHVHIRGARSLAVHLKQQQKMKRMSSRGPLMLFDTVGRWSLLMFRVVFL